MNDGMGGGLVAFDYAFGPADRGDRVFDPERSDPTAAGLRRFRDAFRARGIEVHTSDLVDPADPALDYVLYFDYSWRRARADRYLARVPRPKRALLMLEPPNVNPTLYYVPWLRRRFARVFTWADRLVARHGYTKIPVPMGADPLRHRAPDPARLAFDQRRFLVAINANRWSYMPQSTYALRRRAFRYFERACPEEFDLFGIGWNAPRIFYERWFGHPRFRSYRGAFPYSFEEKIPVLARYRFSLCFENNAREPGYLSEKLLDCLCARCVPIYYGAPGAGGQVPRACFIDFRDFRGFGDLHRFLRAIDAPRFAAYLAAADAFLAAPEIVRLTDRHLRETVIDTLYPARRPCFPDGSSGAV